MNKIKVKCQEEVFQDYHHYPCFNNAKVERDGKWYCGIHDPVRIAEKDTIRKSKYDKEWAIRLERNERNVLMDKILKDKTIDELREMAEKGIK